MKLSICRILKKTDFEETFPPYCTWSIWAVSWLLCCCGEEKLDCSAKQYRQAGPMML